MDIENRLVVAKGEGVGGGLEWEVGVSRCKLLHVEWIDDGVLLCNTENNFQCPVMDHNGKEYLRKGNVCICMNHFSAQ